MVMVNSRSFQEIIVIMKKSFLFLLFALLSIHANSQSLNDLEKEPVFKGLRLGAPIGNYSDILKYRNTIKGKNGYTITDPSYLSIFNIKMDGAIVIEENGRVGSIMLYKSYNTGMFETKELEVLRSSLSSRYGSPNVDLTDFSGTPAVAGYRWETRSVMIDIAFLFMGTGEPGSGLRYILYQRHDDY